MSGRSSGIQWSASMATYFHIALTWRPARANWPSVIQVSRRP